MPRENRCKVLWVNPDDVLHVIGEWMRSGSLYRIEGDSIPADCEVEQVREDWQRKQIGFLLYSPSFDIVPNGMYIPDLVDGSARFVKHDHPEQELLEMWQGRALKAERELAAMKECNPVVFNYPDKSNLSDEDKKTIAKMMESWQNSQRLPTFVAKETVQEVHKGYVPKDVFCGVNPDLTLQMLKIRHPIKDGFKRVKIEWELPLPNGDVPYQIIDEEVPNHAG